MKKLQQFGTALSLVCAAHCVATPVLVGALPLLGHQLEHAHGAEALLVGAAAIIGYVTLGLRYRGHRRLAPLGLLTLGAVLLFLAHAFLPHDASTPYSIMGAFFLAGAQLLDRRYPAACCPGH